MRLANHMAAISDYVAAFGKPEVFSLAEDTHIFHFERDGDWRNAQIVLVNRNGHHFRLVKSEVGRWTYIKTWNSLFDWDDWMDPGFNRTDPEDLIALCGVGPQGRQSYESLSLLPKDSTQRRKAVWRSHILDVRFEKDAQGQWNLFSLADKDGRRSMQFTGKVWESRTAAEWCLQTCPPPMLASATVKSTAVRVQEMAELEGSDLWGMF